MERAHELDTVEFARRIDGWPAGTIGAVVSEGKTSALVEVVSTPGRDLLDDLVSVPYEALTIVERARQLA